MGGSPTQGEPREAMPISKPSFSAGWYDFLFSTLDSEHRLRSSAEAEQHSYTGRSRYVQYSNDMNEAFRAFLVVITYIIYRKDSRLICKVVLCIK